MIRRYLVRLPLQLFLFRARPGGWRDRAVALFFRYTPVWIWQTSNRVDRWMKYR